MLQYVFFDNPLLRLFCANTHISYYRTIFTASLELDHLAGDAKYTDWIYAED